ncbi:MAG: hypothetical protein LBU32_02625 [Clostridiales bacterium]|jgi:hypothetical protein|nr:hypothetical protein [Clostridiales bacterium]
MSRINQYFYNGLTEGCKSAFNAIRAGLNAMAPCIEVNNEANLHNVFSHIVSTMPEYYFVCRKHTYIVKGSRCCIEPSYSFAKEEVRQLSRKLESMAGVIANSIKACNQADYRKVLEIHDYIRKNVTYDYEALLMANTTKTGREDSYTVVGAMIKRKCACSGYAMAMKLLCEKAGIECHVITGTASSAKASGPHAWNAVKISGYYHHVDVTWDNQLSGNIEIPNYGYFGLDDEEISKDHNWDRRCFPPCPQAPYNYFRVNRLLAETEAQLDNRLYEAMRNKETSIMFKVKKNSPLESAVAGRLPDIVKSAARRCSTALAGYNVMTIPNQQVYMLEVIYRS